MFLVSATLDSRSSTMDTTSISEKIKTLAAIVNTNLSDLAASQIRAELLSCANELQSELIDNTLDVHYVYSISFQKPKHL